MGVKCCAANSNLPPRRADPHAEGKNPVGENPSAVGSLQNGPPPPQPPLFVFRTPPPLPVRCLCLVLWYCWLFWAVARFLMSASDTALRLVSAAVIASLKSGMEPRDPCGVDFDYFLEFFSALLRDLAVRSVYIR